MSATKVSPAPGWSPPGAPAILEMPCDSSSFDLPREDSHWLPPRNENLTDKTVFRAELQAFAQKELRRELRRELEDFGARLQASFQLPVCQVSEEQLLRSAPFRPDTPNSLIHVPENAVPEKEGKDNTHRPRVVRFSSQGMVRSDSDSLEGEDEQVMQSIEQVSLDGDKPQAGQYSGASSSNASEDDKVEPLAGNMKSSLSSKSLDNERDALRRNVQSVRKRSLNYRSHIIAKSEMQLTRQQTGGLAQRLTMMDRSSAATSNTEEEEEKTTLQMRMRKHCQKMENILEYPVMIIIVLNGLFLGIQAQYQSENVTQAVPKVFPYFEVLFCLFFSFELAVHLCSQGIQFYSCYRKGWKWSYFDTFLVIAQLVEVFGMLATDHESQNATPVANFSHIRMLRVLRVFRVLRLVRLLNFVGELKTIVSSIFNSMRSLFWTVVLLSMLIYMFGIIFAQLALNARIERSSSELDALAGTDETNMEALDYWWGTLFRSCLTLYEAIVGGCDWDQVLVPLMDYVSIWVCPIFICYIAFAVLAMMNVITGIFVDSALNNAAKEKDADFMDAFRRIMAGAMDRFGAVTKTEFELRMSMEELSEQVRNVGIDPKDAALTFDIIDSEGHGVVHAEDLLAGLLCLRRQAKSMDIAMLLHAVDHGGAQLRTDMKEMLEKDVVREVQRKIDTTTARPPQTGQPNGYQGPVFYLPGATPLGFCDDLEV